MDASTAIGAFRRVAAPLAAALSLAVALTACTPAAPADTGPVLEGRVTRVVDGDTIHVRLADGRSEKVRVIGIDAPEDAERHEPYGPEATAYAREELSDQDVWLETDAELRDRYGRLLAYVWLEEPPASPTPDDVRTGMYDARALGEGYAALLTVPPNVRYSDLFVSFEREAKAANAGLWGLPSE